MDFQAALAYLKELAGVSLADVAPSSAILTARRYTFGDLDADFRWIEKELEMLLIDRLRALDQQLKQRKIALADYYTRQHMLDEELAVLDATRTAREFRFEEARKEGKEKETWTQVLTAVSTRP